MLLPLLIRSLLSNEGPPSYAERLSNGGMSKSTAICSSWPQADNVAGVKKPVAAGIVTVAVALALFAGRAGAGVFHGVAYTPRAMTTMLKAVRYPRATLRKLSCTGLGSNSNGRYISFRCVARWQPHGRKVFYTAGAGDGGWLCVGTSVAGCKVLEQGYAPKSGAQSTPYDVARRAAEGYLQNHFHRLGAAPAKIRPCSQTATNTWVCDYQLSGPPAPPVGIRITLTPVAGGWVLTGAASGGPPPF